MLRRFFVAGLTACAITLVLARPHAASRASGDGYEFWPSCSDLPDDFVFLPHYLGRDVQGFVDLQENLELIPGGAPFRALQLTRDKNFGAIPARTGRWYGVRMGLAKWPLGTVDVRAELAAFRMTAWEVDGISYPVDPSCIAMFDTDELTMGIYNVWVRFTDAGSHTLRVFGRQIASFPFVDPLAGLDPLGLNGRRVFVPGERTGEVIDQQFVHTYELQVGREDDGGGR